MHSCWIYCRELVLYNSKIFLGSEFREKKIDSSKTIKSILKEFCKISETRYFSENDIDYISNYYSEMLKEEIGRGRESKLGDQIDSGKIIYKLTGYDIDDAAYTIKGNSSETENAVDTVAFTKKGNTEFDVEVDDPDAAHVFLKNIEVNVINKIWTRGKR